MEVQLLMAFPTVGGSREFQQLRIHWLRIHWLRIPWLRIHCPRRPTVGVSCPCCHPTATPILSYHPWEGGKLTCLLFLDSITTRTTTTQLPFAPLYHLYPRTFLFLFHPRIRTLCASLLCSTSMTHSNILWVLSVVWRRLHLILLQHHIFLILLQHHSFLVHCLPV